MVDFASKNFTCYKYTTLGYGSFNAIRRLNLDKKKPAILLLDAEGGLLHKQQNCVDPKKFLKIAKSAARLCRDSIATPSPETRKALPLLI